MILTWAGAFIPTQKWLERAFADWVGIRALKWAMRRGFIDALPEGWERAISWTWPTMPHVDEWKESKATSERLSNFTTDYSQLLGPDWEKRLEAMLAQKAKIRAAEPTEGEGE